MKKTITIIVIVILAVGFGYFLFTISPEQPNNGSNNLDLGDVPQISEPREIDSSDHVFGNPEAKNTLIVYEDFQCPACAAFEPTLKLLPDILEDTKLVFRHLPLTTIHNNAVISAFSTEAAAEQGKFWEYVSLLYERQSDWSNESYPIEQFVEIASQVGVADLEKFRTDTEAAINQEKVAADLTEAIGFGLTGTPSLVFNGNQLQLGSVDQIKQQAEQFYIQ